MTKYEICTLSVIVKEKGKPIYDQQATVIEMTDEADSLPLANAQAH